MKKIKFDTLKFPFALKTNSFLSQWCCKCGARHIWYFVVLRGKKRNEDEIYMDIFRDWKGEELAKFYKKIKKKEVKK